MRAAPVEKLRFPTGAWKTLCVSHTNRPRSLPVRLPPPCETDISIELQGVTFLRSHDSERGVVRLKSADQRRVIVSGMTVTRNAEIGA